MQFFKSAPFLSRVTTTTTTTTYTNGNDFLMELRFAWSQLVAGEIEKKTNFQQQTSIASGIPPPPSLHFKSLII